MARVRRPTRLRSCERFSFATTLLTVLFGMTGLGSAEELRIAAWNIEWLGSPDGRSGPAKGVAQDPEDIAEYIKQGNVDILALEEIGDDDSGFKPLNSTLTLAFDRLNQAPGQDWDYLLLPKKDSSSRDQLTGVAWNREKLTFLGVIQVPNLDQPNNEFSEWDRSAHAVKLSAGPGKTDLVIIPVHMKSNRGGVAKTRQQRGLEASLLTSQLQFVRQHFADDDIVILGDTNCLKKEEVAIQAFVAAGFKDLNPDDEPTTFKGPAPFDRIFVTAGEGEFVDSRQDVHKTLSPDDHKVKLSDHYMVVTTIDVIADEDVVTGITPVPPPAPPPGTPPSPVPAPIPPAPPVTPPLDGVRITRLLPNPAGDEDQDESVTIRNFSASPIDLAGFRLRDKAKATWSLSGTLAPNEEKTIKRSGQDMALGNKGDVVELVAPTRKVLDRVQYQNTSDGVEIVVIPTDDAGDDSVDP